MLLVDTGIRASELCRLAVSDLDLKNQRLLFMGKGNKERYLPIAARTRQALWRYLASRDEPKPTAPLFLSSTQRPLDRTGLQKLVGRLGERAGVRNVHPHRFRHTFAITFLRNGSTVFALQRILGHSSLALVR
jgi:integrase/recombinase XerD